MVRCCPALGRGAALGAHILAVGLQQAPPSHGTRFGTQQVRDRLAALGADLSDPAAAVAALKRQGEGKAEALYYDSLVTGATLDVGLQKALDEAIAKLPIPKVMSYQLETDCELPGWTSVNFVRPAHGLVALHGSTVVPVKALGLTAGNQTQGHRFEAAVSPVVLADADTYAETLLRDGAVFASFGDRRFAIVQQLAQAAEKLGPGYEVLMDEALLDEVTALLAKTRMLTLVGMGGLGMCLSNEERESGVRVSNIYPGEVDTPILANRPKPVRTAAHQNMHRRARYVDRVADSRWAQPRLYPQQKGTVRPNQHNRALRRPNAHAAKTERQSNRARFAQPWLAAP